MSEPSSFPRLVTSVKYVESTSDNSLQKPDSTQTEFKEGMVNTVDLTRSITELFTRNSNRIEEISKGGSLFVHEIQHDLDWELRKQAFNREVMFPNLIQNVLEFAQQVQANGSFVEFKEQLEKINNLERSLECYRKELQTFEKSVWTDDLSKFEMFYSWFARDSYFTSSEEEFDSWDWDDYVKKHPRPENYSFDSSEYKAWEEGYQQFKRKSAPPYSYGTNPMYWPGVNVLQVIDHFEDEGQVDVWDIIESSLEDYHEDAIDSVVDGDELDKIIQDWLQSVGSNTRDDKSLTTKLNAWNSKQSIVSYYADETVSVPNFDDTNREEGEQWLKNLISQKEESVMLTKQEWINRSSTNQIGLKT